MLTRHALFAFLALTAAAPAAQWKIIGPGGGGAQFLPTVSPHDPKTALVRCDMTGAYITHDSGASWRNFNLRGVVSFFVFDPVDPKTIYANALGLFRSTDSGRTWRLIYPDPSAVERVIMPDDHAGDRIVLRDGRAARMTALGIHPANSKLLYAGMMEGRGGPASLHSSPDRGKTWKKLADVPGGVRQIYVDRGGAVYVIGANSVGMWRDGQWKAGTPPAGVNAFTDASAGFAGNRLIVYAVSQSGIHISEDAGATWRKSEVEPGVAARMPAIAASLHHPEVAYVSYGIRGKYFGVAKTADTGKTWELAWKDGQTPGPNMHYVWMAQRFGPGWAGNPINLGVGPNHPEICYGTNNGITVRTLDGGKNWYGVYSKAVPGGYTTTGLDVTTNYGVHFDPFDRSRIFISYTDIGLFASENGGQSWDSVTRTAPRPWVNTTYWMEFDPEVKGRVWAVMSGVHDLPRPKMWRGRSTSTYNGGVTVSDDGGKTWRVASESLPPSAATHIVLDPKSPASARVLYITATGRGVFKSVDGGKTWALKNNGIDIKDPLAWRLARTADGTLYLIVARRSDNGSIGDDGDGALFRSRDGAETWERMKLPEGVNGPNGLAIDPADARRLYLAAWGRMTPDGAVNGGIFLSTDGGASWKNVLDKDQHVYDVTIDPRDPKTLYACGFESSAWRSRDRGATWQRIPGYNFKWGHRVVPDPYNPKMIYVTTFGGSVWYGPADGDPSATEDIVTPEVAHRRK